MDVFPVEGRDERALHAFQQRMRHVVGMMLDPLELLGHTSDQAIIIGAAGEHLASLANGSGELPEQLEEDLVLRDDLP
jgi:hypothetical protein